jgi:hypothetical protein
MAGIERAFSEPHLPFFIEWGDEATYPGATESPVDVHLAQLVLAGEPQALEAWLGPHTLPVTVHPGRAGMTNVVLATPAGKVVLGEPARS